MSSSDDSGAAAVEFAIVLPVLVLLLFGIIQFGMLFWRAQGLEAAAREGARVAALGSTTLSTITSRVNDALGDVPFDAAPTIAVAPNTTQPCEGNTGAVVTVTVSAPASLEIPLWGTHAFTLSGTGEFRCE